MIIIVYGEVRMYRLSFVNRDDDDDDDDDNDDDDDDDDDHYFIKPGKRYILGH